MSTYTVLVACIVTLTLLSTVPSTTADEKTSTSLIKTIPVDGNSQLYSDITAKCVLGDFDVLNPLTLALGLKAEADQAIVVSIGNSTDPIPGPHSAYVLQHYFQNQMMYITSKSQPAFSLGHYYIKICTDAEAIGTLHLALTPEGATGIVPGEMGIVKADSTSKGDRVNVRWEEGALASNPGEVVPLEYCVYAIAVHVQETKKSFFYDLSTWKQIEANGGTARVCVKAPIHEASFETDPFTGYYINVLARTLDGTSKTAYGVTYTLTIDVGKLATFAGALALVVFIPCLICACCVAIFVGFVFMMNNSSRGHSGRRSLQMPSMFNRAQGYTEVNMRQVDADEL